MNKKHVERFAHQHLVPSLPGFGVRGRLLYEVPVGNVLRAFLFDSSGFSATTFHPHVFAQTLYILSDHLTLTPGSRFLGHWEFEPGAEFELEQRLLKQIHRVGLPFLRAHSTPEDIVRETQSDPAIRVNPGVQQQLAYSLLWLGSKRRRPRLTRSASEHAGSRK